MDIDGGPFKNNVKAYIFYFFPYKIISVAGRVRAKIDLDTKTLCAR